MILLPLRAVKGIIYNNYIDICSIKNINIGNLMHKVKSNSNKLITKQGCFVIVPLSGSVYKVWHSLRILSLMDKVACSKAALEPPARVLTLPDMTELTRKTPNKSGKLE